MNAPRLHPAFVAFALIATPAGAQIAAQSVVQNLNLNIKLAAPPGDAQRLFVTDQSGQILIVKNGSVLPDRFLDISPEVNMGNVEQGLLGMAFDPDYATNGRFYVNFIGGTGAGKTVIRRYTVSSNPDSADENSGLTLLEITQPTVQHNGGNLAFGPDGYLWIGMGDGGSPGNGQNTATLLGKMLRIDVNGDDFPADSLRNYAIPPDNPFVADPMVLDEIWAIGLRNPFRYSFDSLTGDLYIGDVGGNAYEEINFEPTGSPGGLNFGWTVWEGDSCRIAPCDTVGFTPHIYAYHHTQFFLHAVIGGQVYRGSALPSWLQGHYFFSDQAWEQLWSFRYEGGVVTEFTDWTVTLGVGSTIRFPTDWWEGDDGELYVVEYRQNNQGEIWKLVPDPTAVGADLSPSPAFLALGAPSPNPFRTTMRFEVRAPKDTPVSVNVYDAAGRLIRPLHFGPLHGAPRALGWDGKDSAGRRVSAGVYFIRAKAAGETLTRKVAFLH